MPGLEAFVSLATNDSYATGAIALGKSLRDSCTTRRLALLITNSVSPNMRSRLSRVWDELVVVEELDSGDSEHLALLARPELGVTFSKIHAWRLVQYSKCVFLDADALVLQNVDELFEREELSAAPDIGWPDCFNSGVFVFEPSLETFRNLIELARQRGSFDGGDQGLLNLYWSDWATSDIKFHLPFIYNVTPNITYGYAPAFQQFGGNVKIIHFIGSIKPWQHRYLPEVDAVILYPGSYSSQNAAQDFIKRWWQVYHAAEQPPCDHHGWGLAPPPPPPTPAPLYADPHIFMYTHSWPHTGTPSHPHTVTHSHPHTFTYTHSWPHTGTPSHTVTHSHPPSAGVIITQRGVYTYFDSHHRFTPFLDRAHQAPCPLKSDTPIFIAIPYGDLHSHVSLSFFSNKPKAFDTISNFHSIYRRSKSESSDDDSEIPASPVSITRQFSYPYFYTQYPPGFLSVTSNESPSLFVPSLVSGTENDDVTELPLESHDSRVTQELGSCDDAQPRVQFSDSVPYYLTISPSHTHTPFITLSSPPSLIELVATVLLKEFTSEQEMGGARSVEDVHQREFENGRIDYTGGDRFENIQEHIDSMMNQ